MNTRNKDIKKHAFIKTLSTTLACLVASSALALDDHSEVPKPEEEPSPPEMQRPDLLPLGINLQHDATYDDWDPEQFPEPFKSRHYIASVSIANFGHAGALMQNGKSTGSFYVHVGYKVLATSDAANYPVGYTEYCGRGEIPGIEEMGIVDTAMYIRVPKAATAVELFVVVDRPPDWGVFDGSSDFEGTWEDDFGADYVGAVSELKENNNVLGGKVLNFPEYVLQPAEKPVVVRPTLQVRRK